MPKRYAVDKLIGQLRDVEVSSPSEALKMAEHAYRMAVEADYSQGAAWSLIYLGRAHTRLGNLVEADRVLSSVQSMESLDVAAVAECHNARGIVYVYTETYNKAYEHFSQSLRLASDHGLHDLEARLLSNLGTIYSELKDSESALKYYQQCLAVLDQWGEYRNRPLVLSNIAETYMDIGDLDKAEEHAREALRNAHEQNDQLIASAALELLGKACHKRGHKTQALDLLNQSVQICERTQENVEAVRILVVTSRIHYSDGEYTESLVTLDRALALVSQTDSLVEQLNVLQELTRTCEAIGDVQKALHYHKRCRDMMARIRDTDREHKLRSLAIQIAIGESQRENEAYRALNETLRKKTLELEEANDTLRAISDIGRSITATLDLGEVFALVYKHIKELMPVDAFAVGLYDKFTSMIEYSFVCVDEAAKQPTSVKIDDRTSFAAACFHRKSGILVNSVHEESPLYIEGPGRGTMSSIMYQPLLLEGEPIGVISVQCRNEGAYSHHALDVLQLLSSYLSIAIHNARRSQVLREEIRERELAQQELQRLNGELDRLSNLDGLTGVANRRRLDEFLELTWYAAQRQRGSVSFIMIDGDYIKEYNDYYGHLAGDEVIKQLAQVLRRVVKRRTDLVARYGGDEFAVILSDTDSDRAPAVAEAIRKELEQCAIEHKASPLRPRVTISMGVASMVPGQGSQPSDLIAAADLALYQAKEGGRDRIVVATAGSTPISVA